MEAQSSDDELELVRNRRLLRVPGRSVDELPSVWPGHVLGEEVRQVHHRRRGIADADVPVSNMLFYPVVRRAHMFVARRDGVDRRPLQSVDVVADDNDRVGHDRIEYPMRPNPSILNRGLILGTKGK